MHTLYFFAESPNNKYIYRCVKQDLPRQRTAIFELSESGDVKFLRESQPPWPLPASAGGYLEAAPGDGGSAYMVKRAFTNEGTSSTSSHEQRDVRYTFVGLFSASYKSEVAFGSYETDGECYALATRITEGMIVWLKFKSGTPFE